MMTRTMIQKTLMILTTNEAEEVMHYSLGVVRMFCEAEPLLAHGVYSSRDH